MIDKESISVTIAICMALDMRVKRIPFFWVMTPKIPPGSVGPGVTLTESLTFFFSGPISKGSWSSSNQPWEMREMSTLED